MCQDVWVGRLASINYDAADCTDSRIILLNIYSIVDQQSNITGIRSKDTSNSELLQVFSA